MRYFLTGRQPEARAILLVESGSRAVLERVASGLGVSWGSGVPVDVLTCFPAAPAGLPSGSVRLYCAGEYQTPESRRLLFRELSANRYSHVGIVCSGEQLLMKWKWALALALPAKVFIINENGDYFWLDRTHLKVIRAFALERSGLAGAGAVRMLARGLSFPFAIAYLMLYAAAVHARRFLRLVLKRSAIPSTQEPNPMKAIQVKEHGGPEKLELVELQTPTPGPKQALVRIAASGVNYIDIYFRAGVYKADLPMTLGSEGAGTVEAVGPDVTEVAPGDRVAYAMVRGSYAEYAIVPSALLVKIPGNIDFQTAAAAMLQGMTAHYLTHSTYALKAGDTCLVHAAAGGAGGLIVQMAKMIGARVLGTVSTEAKAAAALESGADEAILYTQVDFEAEVKRLTGGRGVDVVYDSVGKTTFEKSLNCLRPRGTLALFGQSSGIVPPVEPAALAKGSTFLTRPGLGHYVLTREELLWRAGDVLKWLSSGELKLRIHRAYPLAEAAAAQQDLQSRRTTGKLLLLP